MGSTGVLGLVTVLLVGACDVVRSNGRQVCLPLRLMTCAEQVE